ncbi:MAG: hypothetical protein AB7V62_05765, partial [Thermoleophilia bacterium]
FGLLPSNDVLAGDTTRERRLSSPFFYVDDHHSFFVEPTLVQTTVKDWGWFGIDLTVVRHIDDDVHWVDLPVAVEVSQRIPVPPKDPRARFEVTAQGDWLTDDQTVVRFGGGLVRRDGHVAGTNLEVTP